MKNFKVVLFVAAGGLFVASHALAEPEWWTQQKSDCGLSSDLAYNDWDGTCNESSSSGSGGSRNSGYDYAAGDRIQAAAAAQAAAEKAAAEEHQRQQAEAERIERERVAAEKAAKFLADRDSAVSALKGSSGSSGLAMSQLKGLSGMSDSSLKGSGFDAVGTSLKELPSADASGLKGSGSDASVVDARNAPSGLSKDLDKAIASVYSGAQPGVIDRIRKGFQAVMARDWKVAKAWFQDALNHDPNNADLKRLTVLAEPPQESNQQLPLPDPSDMGLGPWLDSKKSAGQAQQVQLPDPSDISPWSLAETKPVFKTLPSGKQVQMPQDSDQELLFNPEMRPPSAKPEK